MKISYLCQWNKDKKNTWSGTTYSLYNALKKEVVVIDYDMKLTFKERILNLPLKIINKIKRTSFYNWNELKFFQQKLNEISKINSKDIILQIGIYGKSKNPSYVYQDLNFEALKYYKKYFNESFQYSGFQHINDNKDLDRIISYQSHIYENLDGIFTMSKWLRDNMIKYSGIPKEKVHWVGAGANVDPSNIKKYNKNNNKILFVGRDFFRKGGDLTYEAFKILKKEYIPDAELYIAGPKKWPLDDKFDGVKFLGDLSYDELSYYFNICDVFCLPSRFEAYGIVFIEALIYGLPCIGKNDFEMKEFIDDGVNGYLIDTEDPKELAIKMYKLLKNKKIISNVIKNRDYYINQYSWQTVAKRMIQVIKEDSLKEEK